MNHYDYLFKILLIGNVSVGKSSIFTKFTDNKYSELGIPTIGVDFKIKTFKVNNKYVKLQIWDTAGQDRFKSVTSSYYRGSHGIIIVFDVTNRYSFNNIQSWITQVYKYSINTNIILVGNKIDLESERQISYEEAKEYADSLEIPYLEVSVKNGTNIDNIFKLLSEKIIKDTSMYSDIISEKLSEDCYISLNEFDKKKEKKCCNY
jgi:Ras-related protein Rab-1A